MLGVMSLIPCAAVSIFTDCIVSPHEHFIVSFKLALSNSYSLDCTEESGVSQILDFEKINKCMMILLSTIIIQWSYC